MSLFRVLFIPRSNAIIIRARATIIIADRIGITLAERPRADVSSRLRCKKDERGNHDPDFGKNFVCGRRVRMTTTAVTFDVSNHSARPRMGTATTKKEPKKRGVCDKSRVFTRRLLDSVNS